MNESVQLQEKQLSVNDNSCKSQAAWTESHGCQDFSMKNSSGVKKIMNDSMEPTMRQKV